MKVTLNILLIAVCCSALVFSREINSNVKKAQIDSSVMVGTMRYSQGYEKFITSDEGAIERKRSHKRRKAVRKPRRGRGQ